MAKVVLDVLLALILLSDLPESIRWEAANQMKYTRSEIGTYALLSTIANSAALRSLAERAIDTLCQRNPSSKHSLLVLAKCEYDNQLIVAWSTVQCRQQPHRARYLLPYAMSQYPKHAMTIALEMQNGHIVDDVSCVILGCLILFGDKACAVASLEVMPSRRIAVATFFFGLYAALVRDRYVQLKGASLLEEASGVGFVGAAFAANALKNDLTIDEELLAFSILIRIKLRACSNDMLQDIIHRLYSPRPSVQRMAVDVLGQLGPSAKLALPHLELLLHADNVSFKSGIREAMRSIRKDK